MTLEIDRVLHWRGRELLSRNGEKIGRIEEIYVDEQTEQPEWALVSSGLFGGKSTFVPIAEAHSTDHGIQVPFDKDKVRDAPRVSPDGDLSADEEVTLYRHYGLDYEAAPAGEPQGGGLEGEATTGEPRPPAREPREAAAVGHNVSGPTTDDAMTRSEEEVRVGTTERQAARVRLRKCVVVEHVTQTVPVRREEVRVEREPITEANAGRVTDGPPISEDEHEVVLHEEQPVVEKRVVPKERVRLGKDTVEEQQQVSDEVRKERIEMEGEGR